MANVTKLMQLKNGQFITTFPKAIAEAMGLKKGSKLEYLIHQGDIIIRKL